MKLTTRDYLESAEKELEYFKKGLREIEEGNFKYDCSMPKSCVDALYKSKVKTWTEAIGYLNTLPENKVLYTGFGSTEELSKYYEIVNK